MPWIMGITVLLLFGLLVILQTSNLWKNLTVETANDLILLYGLSTLNFFAFLVFGFIFLRNLIKLVRERRALELGSQIKSRLLMYFVLISLLPIIAMAGFSYLFMNRALERWFTQIPENVVRETRSIQQQTIADRFVRLDESARMLASLMDETTVDNTELARIANVGNLSYIAIQGPNGAARSQFERALEPSQKQQLDELLMATQNGSVEVPAARDGVDFDLTRVAMKGGSSLIVVPNAYTKDSVNQIVDSSLAEFDRLKDQQVTIRQVAFLTLGILTFLLIFASMWIAFYVARGLTAPIKALAIGADEIARGNLGHRVDVLAEDELAKLVEAFNVMSSKLEENQGELTERRRYIETLIAALPTGVMSFDENNKLTTINAAAEAMLGTSSVYCDGKTPDEIFPSENATAIERLLNRAKRTGTATDHATLLRETDEFNVAMTASHLPDAAGTVLVIEDLSELLAAQRAAAWQEVARRMAHEIKNPLTPIQLSDERISKRFNATGHQDTAVGKRIDDKGPVSDVVSESTATILREVESLKTMVDEFSRFARLPDTVLSPGDLGEVIEQAVASFDGKFAGVDIAFDRNGGLPETMLDAEQLKRVFVNLIENASEALTDGGNVTVTARHDTAREIIVAEVADNGPGIQQRDLPKLFQPYFSTKGRGTGLGLAIVHRIVSEHKGKIHAVANQPNGAKFIIELPIAT